jgi:hypothetical protein
MNEKGVISRQHLVPQNSSLGSHHMKKILQFYYFLLTYSSLESKKSVQVSGSRVPDVNRMKQD